MKEKNKCIEEMLFSFEVKCIELCRDDDTAILSYQNQTYIMFKNDINTANKIIKYILGD